MGNVIVLNENNNNMLTGMTPYHSYMSITRWETILEDIERDLIPTNTGVTFPVTFEDDFKDQESESLFDLKPEKNFY